MGIPPFDNKLRSDEWTAQLHQHKILGYVGVYVDDLLIAGPRTLNETLIKPFREYGRRALQNTSVRIQIVFQSFDF